MVNTKTVPLEPSRAATVVPAKQSLSYHDLVLQEFKQRQPPQSMGLSLASRRIARYEETHSEKTTSLRSAAMFGVEPSASTLKIFGVGLSRTGTSSLASFFTTMGLKVIHFDMDLTAHLPRSANTSFEWRGVYDGFDAVFDLPTAFYYRELLSVYPQALFVSSYRTPDNWYASFANYLQVTSDGVYMGAGLPIFNRMLHKEVYGSEEPDRALWIAKYEAHYADVKTVIPAAKLLQLDVDKWQTQSPAKQICTFLTNTVNAVDTTASAISQCPVFSFESIESVDAEDDKKLVTSSRYDLNGKHHNCIFSV